MEVMRDISDIDLEVSDLREQLRRYDNEKLWNIIYERLKNQSTVLSKDTSTEAARDARNRWKNRYRDVSPYDSTRVFLCDSYDGDYINASFIAVPEVHSRRYILTQGPMQQTVKHFWLMVWEQRSPAIVMLNRLVEKGSGQCYPYFPCQGGPTTLEYEEFGLLVHLDSEVHTKYFTQRIFDVEHLASNQHHRVLHMHYTSWPDFGVPSSPSGLLNFLWAVRASGVLDDPLHPSVIHCSAGVGRSGAFVLIDLALYMVERDNSVDTVSLTDLFIQLRQCRMGIIQTADQLRFCFRAVVKGADTLLSTPAENRRTIRFEQDNDEDLSRSNSDIDIDSDQSGDDEVDLLLDEEDEDDLYTLEDALKGNESIAKQTDDPNQSVRLRNLNQSTEFTNRVSDLGVAWLPNTSSDVDASHYVRPCQTGLDPWNDANVSQALLEAPKNLSNNELYQDMERPPSSLMEFLDRSDIPPAISDRSNNAVPVGLMEQLAAHPPPESHLHPPNNPMDRIATANGDNADQPHHLEQPVSEEIVPSTRAPLGAQPNSVLSPEYMAVSSDVHQRHLARMARRARMREQIEEIRARMREADLERKRWLPARVLHYLRRFYGESGYVRGPVGAVLSTVFIVAAFGFSTMAYMFWFSGRYALP